MHLRRGFTLIELLLSISIIAVIAAIVIVAVNPSKQFGDAQDGRRAQSINQVEKALSQYLIDYGEFPGNPSIPVGEGNALPVCRASFAESGGNCLNLDMLLYQHYLPCLPHDGLESDPEQSGYTAYQDNGRARVTSLYVGQGSAGSWCEGLPEPVAHWQLDEETIGETVTDYSTNKYHGSHEGVTSPEGPNADTPSTVFENPRSLRLHGDDYADMGSFSVPGEALTLSAWFKIDVINYDPRVLEKAEGPFSGGAYWMIGIDQSSTDLRFRVYTDVGGMDTVAGGSVSTDVWTHIAGVYNGSTMKIYQDGTEVGSMAKTGSLRTGGASIFIGENPPDAGWTRPFDGFVDEVRIYDTALEAGQVLSLALGNP